MSSATLQLTQDLVACRSITPYDAGAQNLLAQRLEKLGFTIERMRFDDVDNLWAYYGETKPLFVFVGHTDVVPPGDESKWLSPPFVPTIKDGYLYGRGVADMKGGVAAMLVAIEQFLTTHDKPRATLGFLVTSDEEGIAKNGIKRVMPALASQGVKFDYCLVGEPSSADTLGDQIKYGRRGSLNGQLSIIGKQGHIAHPHLAKNPIHLALGALNELAQRSWDQGDEHFPPSCMQISNIHSGTGAENVIPATLDLSFNFRYSPQHTADSLKAAVTNILDHYQLDYQIRWHHSGKPYLTKPGHLINICRDAVKSVTGIMPELSTAGGTSDGRFIAPYGTEVVEFGLCNKTIHQINECAKTSDLDTLSDIYYHILCHVF